MIGLRLWRQRRRIILCIAFAGLAGLAVGGLDWKLPTALACVMAVLAGITVVTAPHLRWFVLKLSVLLAAFAGFAAATGLDPVYVALAALAAVFIVPSQFWGLDAYKAPWISCEIASVHIEKSVDTVWQVVRPVPGAPFWDPNVEQVLLGKEPDGLLLRRRMPDGQSVDHALQLLDIAPLRFLKIRDTSLPTADKGGPVTLTTFRFDGGADRCRLVLIEATWARPLWSSISLWLDDYLGDHADHMAAVIEGRPDPSLKGEMLRALKAARRR